MKRLIMILLTFVCVNPFFAEIAVKIGGVHYLLFEEGDVRQAGVTYTGKDSWSKNKYSGDIVIPESIVYQGKAYEVKLIFDGAFDDCKQLKSVSIPSTIFYIGLLNPFSGSQKLSSIHVDPNNKKFCDIDGVLFNKDTSEIFAYPAGKITSTYSIPDGVRKVGDYALGSLNLTSIYIPNTVTEIGKKAFIRCENLKEIHYPSHINVSDVDIPTRAKKIAYQSNKNYRENKVEQTIKENIQNKSIASNENNPIISQVKSIKKPSFVDTNIPVVKVEKNNIYVLIISNESYQYLDKVFYAVNDGKVFKEYCEKVLGVPKRQVFYYENATFGNLADGVEKLKYCLNNFENSKAIVYYCGHGIPDEKTGQAYLIPVDGKGTNMTTCYSLKNLYKTLAATKAESITYFMDACFTGANKEGSMLVAARGVAREPVKETLAGKTVVFSASSGDETAMTLEEQGHGLFTYYLLKKLQETEGNVTYGELADYINKNVKKDAFLINEKPQTPIVATSPAVQNTWKTMKLK